MPADAMMAERGAARSWRFGAPEYYALAAVISVAAATYIFVTGDRQSQQLLNPAIIAAIMVANLVPAMSLIVLIGSRIARVRAATSLGGGNGRLHVRLVALFSLIAAAPTLLVVIFASLLFQQGVDFWFSERSRGMFENAAGLAEGYYQENQREVGANAVVMAKDLRAFLARAPIEDPSFTDYYLQQVVVRSLNESAIIEIGPDDVARTAAMVDPDNREAENRIPAPIIARLDKGEEVVVSRSGDRIEAATRLDPRRRIYLYVSRDSQVLGAQQFERARAVLADYNALFARSRQLQLQFNLALYLGSLLLLSLAVVAAIVVADRIVRPLGILVDAARTAAGGDLSVRVEPSWRDDEIAVLARAFNSMTEQLQGQTGALLRANDQLEARRAFIETVLSRVSSGVVSLDGAGNIRLANAAAEAMLGQNVQQLTGRPLVAVAPELARLIDGGQSDAVLSLVLPGREPTTVAAKAVALNDGHVLSFEDITQQLHDQRRAAWSDVARRIAHEIKNPLTPIQLAAERLQRRFGRKLDEESGVFSKLTDTIVRQVADVRRMVDEFSSFARMPAPTFGEEDLRDIVRQSVFLFEVARPDIGFSLHAPDAPTGLVCDRHLLSQAITNVVKNAVEAIDEKQLRDQAVIPDGGQRGQIRVDIALNDASMQIRVTDTGIGLPADRDRIFEPYMTTRASGTGLGLAIVKKIIGDHLGEIDFADAPGGGASIVITLYPQKLQSLAGKSGDVIEAAAETVPGRTRIRRAREDHGA
ncbi:MAG: HAMP domain-containing protein [Sphingopyxis sp.]|nr:HAMP domain-containing protein [Sphingopyxis sp.]